MEVGEKMASKWKAPEDDGGGPAVRGMAIAWAGSDIVISREATNAAR